MYNLFVLVKNCESRPCHEQNTMRAESIAHVNDFAHAMVLLGKSLLKHDQMKSRNTEKNCTMEQR